MTFHQQQDILSDTDFCSDLISAAGRINVLLDRASGATSECDPDSSKSGITEAVLRVDSLIAHTRENSNINGPRWSSSPKKYMQMSGSLKKKNDHCRTNSDDAMAQEQLISMRRELRASMGKAEAAAVYAAAELDSRGASLRQTCALLSSLALTDSIKIEHTNNISTWTDTDREALLIARHRQEIAALKAEREAEMAVVMKVLRQHGTQSAASYEHLKSQLQTSASETCTKGSKSPRVSSPTVSFHLTPKLTKGTPGLIDSPAPSIGPSKDIANLKARLKSKVEQLADSLSRANSERYESEIAALAASSRSHTERSRSPSGLVPSVCISSFASVRDGLLHLLETLGLTPDDPLPPTASIAEFGRSDDRTLRDLFAQLRQPDEGKYSALMQSTQSPSHSDYIDVCLAAIRTESNLAVRALHVCASALRASFDVWSQLLADQNKFT